MMYSLVVLVKVYQGWITAMKVLPRVSTTRARSTQYRVSSQKYRADAVVITPSSAERQNHNVKKQMGTLF
jgi:hypothetical protein